MMQNFVRPASILLYFLAILVFFLAGMSFAAFTGVAEDEGLTGGATLLWHGLIFGMVAFVIALFVVLKATHRMVVAVNRILAVVLLIGIAILTFRFFSINS